MKKKKTKPKATNVSVAFEFEEDQRPVKATMYPNGDIFFFDSDGNEVQPKTVSRETTHDRPKGPKVRTRQVLGHAKGAFSGLQHLAAYDSIFAIDTK